MTEPGLYLLKLAFSAPSGMVGAGSMTLAVAVDAAAGTLHGQAQGTILQGTQHPQTFSAQVSGAMHSTGFGSIVRVGAASGEAAVSVAPPAIGTYLAPFSASFGVDSNWSGQGQFVVGSHSYPCTVTKVD
ncbi:MAG: DUF1842 domain-containing protein [Betaproteobacteria bacterium]